MKFRITLIAICVSSRDQWDQWQEWDRSGSFLGLVRSNQDLLCPIQLSAGLAVSSSLLFRALSTFVPVAALVHGRCWMVLCCLGMSPSVSLLEEVPWCHVTGRCCMIFPCCPPRQMCWNVGQHELLAFIHCGTDCQCSLPWILSDADWEKR